jgi:hypothetical protein
MAIPKEDWIKDTVWIEFYLTNTGWMRGTKRTEKGRFENEIEPPVYRLMTVRCLECIPDEGHNRPTEKTEIRWCSDDLEKVTKAQIDWGALPHDAPPLSPQSASKHLALTNLAIMRLPELRRPRGKRDQKKPEWSAWSKGVF